MKEERGGASEERFDGTKQETYSQPQPIDTHIHGVTPWATSIQGNNGTLAFDARLQTDAAFGAWYIRIFLASKLKVSVGHFLEGSFSANFEVTEPRRFVDSYFIF